MSQNSSVQLPFESSHYLKYDKSENSAKYHKILMSNFEKSSSLSFVEFKTRVTADRRQNCVQPL